MDDFGGGLDYTGWKPTDIELRWDRTVVGVRGGSLQIDAPITTALTKEFGGAYIVAGHHRGELTECGVENLTMESAPTIPSDNTTFEVTAIITSVVTRANPTRLIANPVEYITPLKVFL